MAAAAARVAWMLTQVLLLVLVAAACVVRGVLVDPLLEPWSNAGPHFGGWWYRRGSARDSFGGANASLFVYGGTAQGRGTGTQELWEGRIVEDDGVASSSSSSPPPPGSFMNESAASLLSEVEVRWYQHNTSVGATGAAPVVNIWTDIAVSPIAPRIWFWGRSGAAPPTPPSVYDLSLGWLDLGWPANGPAMNVTYGGSLAFTSRGVLVIWGGWSGWTGTYNPNGLRLIDTQSHSFLWPATTGSPAVPSPWLHLVWMRPSDDRMILFGGSIRAPFALDLSQLPNGEVTWEPAPAVTSPQRVDYGGLVHDERTNRSALVGVYSALVPETPIDVFDPSLGQFYTANQSFPSVVYAAQWPDPANNAVILAFGSTRPSFGTLPPVRYRIDPPDEPTTTTAGTTTTGASPPPPPPPPASSATTAPLPAPAPPPAQGRDSATSGADGALGGLSPLLVLIIGGAALLLGLLLFIAGVLLTVRARKQAASGGGGGEWTDGDDPAHSTTELPGLGPPLDDDEEEDGAPTDHYGSLRAVRHVSRAGPGGDDDGGSSGGADDSDEDSQPIYNTWQ